MKSYIVKMGGVDLSVKLSEKTAKRIGAKEVQQVSKTGPSDAELAKQQAEEEAKQAAEAKAAAEEAEKAEAEKKAAEKAKETKPQNKAKTPQKK